MFPKLRGLVLRVSRVSQESMLGFIFAAAILGKAFIFGDTSGTGMSMKYSPKP